ncbi:MAG TPA: oligopeptide/dipeptide ABC transporter ATP-binding protein [Solirubrobacteraceae bacterium]|jgi:oligopeptide/dipeptide ABC transporter ATP-binding protein|nr:oligopeptide/dipeptide ABC transporter ATP-binding protein [Solirubrobacteraceae bacterium]
MSAEPLIELVDVHKRYRAVHALAGVSLSVMPGETLGIVGESGCGKSTIARLVMGLEKPSGGELRFRGEPYPRSPRRLRQIRRRVGIVFQDPYDSLDPRFTLEHLVDEPLRAHGLPRGRARIQELLTSVGMENADLDSYPGQYSGGQRQRIGIARALALEPDVIVCDEPTSALDVSVQAQILNLLLTLQRERGLAYLFISHDLEVVRRMSDRLAVIYAGTIVEEGAAPLITSAPSHPYTRALLDAVPATRPSERHVSEPRVLPEPLGAERTACLFAPRCPRRAKRCLTDVPQLRSHDDRLVACHFPLQGGDQAGSETAAPSSSASFQA